jgi:UDP-glucose:(heptosyl)LPS alpha-1,3-glucosyltransferase
MRIAFLVESIDLERGGAERAVMAMARELESNGQGCAIVAPGDRAAADNAPGPKLITMKPRHSRRAQRAEEIAAGLSSCALEHDFDTLVSCGKIRSAQFHWPHGGVHRAGLEASCYAGRSQLRGRLAALGRRLRPVEKVFRNIEDDIYQRAKMGRTKLIALSEKVKRDMVNFHGIPEQTIALCRNGAPKQLFQAPSPTVKAQKRQRLCDPLGIPKDALLAFFIAMNPRLKGSQMLARLMKKEPGKVHIIYIGKKPPHSLASQERWIGIRNDIPELLPLGDVLLLPSHYDPCSLISLEAMASGLPIITTVHNGAAEILNGQGCFVQSDKDLALALKALIKSPSLREKQAQLSLKCARSWTVSEAADHFLTILEHGL